MENLIDERGVTPLAVNMSRARILLDCGNDLLYDLIHRGEIESFTVGNKRKVVVASLQSFIAKRLAANDGSTFVPAAHSPPVPPPGPRKRLPRKSRGR